MPLTLVCRLSRVFILRLLVGQDRNPSLLIVSRGQLFVNTHRSLVARLSSLGRFHRLFARRRRLCFFIACCRWMAFVRRYSSCGDAIVVSSASLLFSLPSLRFSSLRFDCRRFASRCRHFAFHRCDRCRFASIVIASLLIASLLIACSSSLGHCRCHPFARWQVL